MRYVGNTPLLSSLLGPPSMVLPIIQDKRIVDLSDRGPSNNELRNELVNIGNAKKMLHRIGDSHALRNTNKQNLRYRL